MQLHLSGRFLPPKERTCCEKRRSTRRNAGNIVSWGENIGQLETVHEILYIMHQYASLSDSSDAPGGGRFFLKKKPIGEVGVVNPGWQSESTDGPKFGVIGAG